VAGAVLTAYLLPFPFPPPPPVHLPHFQHHAHRPPQRSLPSARSQFNERWGAVDIYTRLGCRAHSLLGQGSQTDGYATAWCAHYAVSGFRNDKRRQADLPVHSISPGGSVTAGSGESSTPFQTSNRRWSHLRRSGGEGMGAFSWRAGTKGKRVALPHSRIMIHQPLGWHQPTPGSGHRDRSREILRMKDMLNHSLRVCAPDGEVAKDTDRDYFLSAAERWSLRPYRSGHRATPAKA